MLFLQFKQAEIALADGRLDEAFALVSSADARSYRRGQALVTELIEALCERATTHLSAGLAKLAVQDCERAARLGGNMPAIVSIQEKAQNALCAASQARRDRVMTEAQQTASGLLSELQTALDAGRLELIDSLWRQLLRVDATSAAAHQAGKCVEQARAAWNCLGRGELRESFAALRRLELLLPQAGWIEPAVKQLQSADAFLHEIRTGPLGLLAMEPSHHKPAPPPISREAPVSPGAPCPSSFLLRVDGAGSVMVVCHSKVTLGPISSSKQPDVPLIAEPGAPLVMIERVEDDYFLRGSNRLLVSGDRIAISPRCKVQFSIPSASSTTAAVDLVSGRFPLGDARRVLLLDRELIIGPGASAHLRADHLAETIVLQRRDGQLWHRAQRIEPGVSTNINGVSMVVQKV